MSVRRHLHYGSTPNFPNFYKSIEQQALWKRYRNSKYYMEDASEEYFNNSYEALASEPLALPTIIFTGTEKLHGENMAVCFSQDEIWVQGRNNIRTLLGDQNGMALFVETTKDIWLDLFDQLANNYNISTEFDTIVIDCEWAGGNIQKGNAACSGTDKGAYIFDHFRVVDNNTSKTQYKPTEGLNIPSGKSVYLMSSFGRYNVVLDFNDPIRCETQLSELVDNIEANSPIANYFDKPNNVGEGIYFTSVLNGDFIRLKAKGTKHGGKPKQPRTPKVTATPEEVKHLEELADKVTPEWRLTQAITETKATERKHLGEVIKWVITDIAKEEEPALIAYQVELKNLSRYISSIVKDYYFDSIKSY